MDSYRKEASEWFGNYNAVSEYLVGKSWHPGTLDVGTLATGQESGSLDVVNLPANLYGASA